MEDGPVRVEIAWVDESRVVLHALELPAGATVGDALESLEALRDDALRVRIEDGRLTIGVYGKPCARSSVLHDGDRIELVGALVVDPKEARRRRVQQRRDDGSDRRWQRRSS